MNDNDINFKNISINNNNKLNPHSYSIQKLKNNYTFGNNFI